MTQEIRANRLERRLEPVVPFPHRHSFYHLVIIRSGNGWHEIDFERHRVRPHQVFVMKPGQVHSWKMARDTKGYILEFGSESVFQGTIPALLSELPPLVQFGRSGAWEKIHHLLEYMIEEYEALPAGFESCLVFYLSAILIELSRAEKGRSQEMKSLDPFIARYLELVERNFRREHRVQFYADLMETTPKALTMRASRSLGQSARDVIQDRCLLESKRLLAYSNRTIAEIGENLGFEDPNYFSRFFRENAGLSPGAFRERARSLS
jgi:AraC-like DNA-binding protein